MQIGDKNYSNDEIREAAQRIEKSQAERRSNDKSNVLAMLYNESGNPNKKTRLDRLAYTVELESEERTPQNDAPKPEATEKRTSPEHDSQEHDSKEIKNIIEDSALIGYKEAISLIKAKSALSNVKNPQHKHSSHDHNF